MTGVADANVLIVFARAGLFYLIPSLFDSVLISPEVYDEVVVEGAGRPGAAEIQTTPKIRRQAAVRPDLLTDLTRYSLDTADASVILLAVECGPDFVLSDDRRVREVAQALSLAIMGSGGLLVTAKARGLISAVKPQLDRLRQQGARIGTRTYGDILRAAGE